MKHYIHLKLLSKQLKILTKLLQVFDNDLKLRYMYLYTSH